MSLETNLQNCLAEISAAQKRSSYSAQKVKLIGVTKRKSAELIRQANLAGLKDFGENYLQEINEKFDFLEGVEANWHFIGKLQGKKIKEIVGRFQWIHSLDNLEHAREISKRASSEQSVLVQVNLSSETSKGGVLEQDLAVFLREAQSLPNLNVEGLMTMPPLSEEPEQARPYFKKLRELAQKFDLSELSMGTTGDYTVAVEEGATMVRVGRLIFGERD